MSSDKIYTMLITKETTHIESHYGDPLTVKHDNFSYAIDASADHKKYDGMIITTKEQHEKLCDEHKMLRMMTATVFGPFNEGEDAWHINVIEVARAIKDEDAIVSFKKKENEKTTKRYGYKMYKDVDWEDTMQQRKIKMFDFPVGKCRLAYTYAKYCHSEMDQKRKGSGEPYFVHPKYVAKLVMENGGNEDQIISAFCHDLLEDVPFVSYEDIKQGFNQHVADLVLELTNQRYKIEEIGKEAYMSEKLMKLSNEALLVKLCDILANITDLPTETQEVRMLKNVGHLILNRKDLSDNTLRLAIQIFGE